MKAYGGVPIIVNIEQYCIELRHSEVVENGPFSQLKNLQVSYRSPCSWMRILNFYIGN